MKLHHLLTAAALTAVVACNGEETGPSHGAVAGARIVVGAATVPSGGTITLTASQATLFEVQFLDSDGHVVTGIEDSHHATLTFTPAALASSADVAAHHFQKTVTPQASAGSGTVMVGYGHDAAADEASYGPFNVVVQ